MLISSRCFLLASLFGFASFIGLMQLRAPLPALSGLQVTTVDRVVISAPVLLVLNAGDRFLAANLETMRLAATGVEGGLADDNYLVRAQRVVSELNACQAHNYYLANALLTWGGAIDEGQQILRRAMTCRYWDELPPFFYGFNQFFFNHDVPSARLALEVAATRASNNAAGFRKLAVMLAVEQIPDERMALDFLMRERASAKDARLAAMLDKRVIRLQGLVTLRDAQRAFEEKGGQALVSPEQLVQSGILEQLPNDPLHLGYEFVDGHFMLKKLKVAGAGSNQ